MADDALVQLVGGAVGVVQRQARVQVVRLAGAAQQEVAHLGVRLGAALWGGEGWWKGMGEEREQVRAASSCGGRKGTIQLCTPWLPFTGRWGRTLWCTPKQHSRGIPRGITRSP